MGNPFTEDSKDLLNLNSTVIIPDKVISTVRKIEDLGKYQYDSYIASEQAQNQSMPQFHTNYPRSADHVQ